MLCVRIYENANANGGGGGCTIPCMRAYGLTGKTRPTSMHPHATNPPEDDPVRAGLEQRARVGRVQGQPQVGYVRVVAQLGVDMLYVCIAFIIGGLEGRRIRWVESQGAPLSLALTSAKALASVVVVVVMGVAWAES